MKNKILICIVGGSGSGKSTLEDEIIIHDGFTKAVSTTTREKRDGEQNNREYHFVSESEFRDLVDTNKLVEHVEFAGNHYGLTIDEFTKTDDNLVFVLEPNGLDQITKYIDKHKLDITPIIIYMNITEKERFKNMLKRGDDPISIQERLKAETIVEDFASYGFEPDVKVSKLSDTTSETVMEDIYKVIEIIKKDK